ncbi:MAG: hypothetical protein OEZ34_03215, partial [Spirochaetia bacterium]|nr:hypothetical protein [Spirochaetia bacterium]
MIRQKYKKFLLKQGRSLIEMTLLFPGVATLFPIFTGIAFNLVLADETAKQPGRSSLPIAETTVIAVLILVSALLRWKLSGKSHLLAPMKPNKKPYINTNMEVYPENPNEIKALVALERFKASVLATRVPLAIASITLTIMISENPEWIMMGPAILIILLYGKFQVPKLSFLEQAIEELSYQQVSESIDMNDFKPSHIADLEKFQKADTTAPNQAVKPEMPEMPESPPPDELIHLQKNDDLEGIARYAWLDLSRSENQCSGFDY